MREIQEELEATIKVGDLIDTIEYDYPTFHLSMDCFWCEVVDGTIKLLEAEDAKWLTKNTLYDVQWLPADITLISKIEKMMGLVKFTAPEDRVVRGPDKVTDAEMKKLIQLEIDLGYSYVDLVEKVGVSKKTIAEHIKSLKEKSIIKKIGNNKKGYWEIKD